ncbi:MAG: hypothetical protein Q9212_002523 [Teloschistes hypoglaucus]
MTRRRVTPSQLLAYLWLRLCQHLHQRHGSFSRWLIPWKAPSAPLPQEVCSSTGPAKGPKIGDANELSDISWEPAPGQLRFILGIDNAVFEAESQIGLALVHPTMGYDASSWQASNPGTPLPAPMNSYLAGGHMYRPRVVPRGPQGGGIREAKRKAIEKAKLKANLSRPDENGRRRKVILATAGSKEFVGTAIGVLMPQYTILVYDASTHLAFAPGQGTVFRLGDRMPRSKKVKEFQVDMSAVSSLQERDGSLPVPEKDHRRDDALSEPSGPQRILHHDPSGVGLPPVDANETPESEVPLYIQDLPRATSFLSTHPSPSHQTYHFPQRQPSTLYISVAVNMFSIKKLIYTSVALNTAGIGSMAIAILIKAKTRQSKAFVFHKFFDGTGPDGQGWSVRASPVHVALIGVLMPQYTILGYDANAQLCEETKRAVRDAPLALVYSVVASGIVGFLVRIALLFSIQDFEELSSLSADSGATEVRLDADMW